MALEGGEILFEKEREIPTLSGGASIPFYYDGEWFLIDEVHNDYLGAGDPALFYRTTADGRVQPLAPRTGIQS